MEPLTLTGASLVSSPKVTATPTLASSPSTRSRSRSGSAASNVGGGGVVAGPATTQVLVVGNENDKHVLKRTDHKKDDGASPEDEHEHERKNVSARNDVVGSASSVTVTTHYSQQHHHHRHCQNPGHANHHNYHPTHPLAILHPDMPIPPTRSGRIAALNTAVKYGTFESFIRIADSVVPDSNETVVGQSAVDLLDAYGEDGHTLAHWACKRHPDTRFIDYLSNQNCHLHKPSVKDDVGMYPIHWAATEGSIPIASVLLSRIDNAMIYTGGGTGEAEEVTDITEKSSPLFDTGSNGNGGTGTGTDSTLSRGPDGFRSPRRSPVDDPNSAFAGPLNARDKSGCTPLLVAAQYGHANLVAFLIKRGADVLALDDNRDSALHWAGYKGAIEVVGLLCHISSSCNAESSRVARNDGGRGGVSSVENNDGNAGKEFGANVPSNGSSGNECILSLDATDVYGQTPVHLAALRGNADVLEYLLEEAEIQSSYPSSSCPSPPELIKAKDRDGRTPVDLALKHHRAGCQVILLEWKERYQVSQDVTHHSSKLVIFFHSLDAIRKATKQLLSLDSWRAWMGIGLSARDGGGSGSIAHQQRRLKWPFILVIVTMTWALAMYPLRFVPLPALTSTRTIVVTGGSSALLLMFTLTSMAVMWASFLLTWLTNPGLIESFDKKMKNTKINKKKSHGKLSFGNIGIENRKIETELNRIAGCLRSQYDEALERYALEGTKTKPLHQDMNGGSPLSNDRTSPVPPLCHTCHIVKPLRSKHCRVQRKCVLLFDHYCPFVGNTVGLYNYRYFYTFLVSLTFSEIGFLLTWCEYLKLSQKWEVFTLLSGIFVGMFLIPVLGMVVYHTMLICRNLTTNEHQNLWRYAYLQDKVTKRYYNPFDTGILNNVYGRMFPSEEQYNLEVFGDEKNNTDGGMREGRLDDDDESQVLMSRVIV